MSINHFQLGYSKQLYYFLNFSSDTARLHYLERNGDADQEKGVYNIRLDANNAEAEGMYLGYTFSWKDLRVNTILTYLNLQDLYYGQASGTFDPAVTTDNDTNILIDYAYPEDKIFDRDVLLLDHYNQDNPFYVRRFHDELVQIDQQRFLATSHYRWRGQWRFLCYFALLVPEDRSSRPGAIEAEF